MITIEDGVFVHQNKAVQIILVSDLLDNTFMKANTVDLSREDILSVLDDLMFLEEKQSFSHRTYTDMIQRNTSISIQGIEYSFDLNNDKIQVRSLQ